MAFTEKEWEDSPSTDTPVSAAALIDAEDRLSDYTDSIAAGGVELGSVAITSNATRAATSYADVSGLSLTVTVGTRPILVIFSSDTVYNTTGSGGARVGILEDGTVVDGGGNFFTGANEGGPFSRVVRRAPAAGSHTYKIQLKTLLTGTATITAGDGASANAGPARLIVIEV